MTGKMGKTFEKIPEALPPIILIISSIFLFGPFTIYSGNIEELFLRLPTILAQLILPAIIVLVCLCIVYQLLPKQVQPRFVSILFVIGILLWLQGNVLVWRYGLLDGQAFDWSQGQWRGLLDGTLWVGGLIVGFLFYRGIRTMAATASMTLIFLQALLLGWSSFRQPEIWVGQSNEDSIRAADAIFDFSSSQNTLHFILDAFQADVFEEIVKEDEDYYRDALEGFTFFKENSGSYPNTFLSIPAILSGIQYKNDVPMRGFIQDVLGDKTIPNALYDRGYGVDLVHYLSLYNTGKFTNKYSLDEYQSATMQQFQLGQAAMVMDLVLFRYVPHYLKRYVYRDQSWLIQPFFMRGDVVQLRPFTELDFVKDLASNLTAERVEPVYKFIHLMSSHAPYVMTGDCGYAGEVLPYNRENIKNQSRCTLNAIIDLLEKLKSLDLYQDALIIINGDHGSRIPVFNERSNQEIGGRNFEQTVGSALPLLIVKQPAASGPLRDSDAQVMLTDIPATVSAVLELDEEFPGQSIFEVVPGEDRERRYYHHGWDQDSTRANYFPEFIEFIINGSVYERASWSLGTAAGRRRLESDRIDFGTQNIWMYLDKGWRGSEQLPDGSTFNWALGESASVRVSLPTDESLLMLANLRTLSFEQPQIVTIKVDGEEVGQWEVSPSSEWAEYRVMLEGRENSPEVSVIEFDFSQHLEPETGSGRDPLAMMFESITFADSE